MQLKYPEAMELARLHRRQKRYAEAKALLEQILEIFPDDAQALYELAVVAYGLGKLEIAVNFMLQSLEQDDTKVTVYVDLGQIHLELADHEPAEAAFREALKFEPGRLEALMGLGKALHGLGRFREAIGLFEKAVKGHPKFSDGYFQKGRAFYEHGKLEESALAYRRALQLDQTQWGAMNNLAATYRDMGKTARAASVFRQALKRNPNYPRAHYGLAAVKRFPSGDAWFDTLKRLVASPELSIEERGFLLYALGKAHDRIGAYDQAFAYFRQANEERAKEFPYSRNEDNTGIDDLIAGDAAATPGLHGDPNGDVVPVFVVGLSRSGKTLTESLLANATGVADGREQGFFRTALLSTAREASLPQYQDRLPIFDQPQLTAIGRRYHEMFAEFVGDKDTHIVNTSPLNLYFVGPILRCMPNAKIVYCERGLLDHALYIYFKRYEESHPYAYNLGDAANHIENSRRMMKYWIDRDDEERILSIKYEDLVSNPSSVLRTITDHIGIAPLPAKVTKNVDTNEVGHWRHYARHLGELRSQAPEVGDVDLDVPKRGAAMG